MTSPMDPCDVVISNNSDVYVNGQLIGNVISVTADRDYSSPFSQPRVTLEFQPTSLMYGDIPRPTVEAMAEELEAQVNDQTVSVGKAIQNQKYRAVAAQTIQAGTPVTVAPVPRKMPPKKRVTSAYAADEEPAEVMGT